MALMVFDNIPFVELLTPTLSTFVQLMHEMGREAASLLLQAIEQANELEEQHLSIQEKHFACRLIICESSQPIVESKTEA